MRPKDQNHRMLFKMIWKRRQSQKGQSEFHSSRKRWDEALRKPYKWLKSCLIVLLSSFKTFWRKHLFPTYNNFSLLFKICLEKTSSGQEVLEVISSCISCLWLFFSLQLTNIMPSHVLDTVQCTKDSVSALKAIILSETRKALFILYSILSIQVSMTKEGIHDKGRYTWLQGIHGCKLV